MNIRPCSGEVKWSKMSFYGWCIVSHMWTRLPGAQQQSMGLLLLAPGFLRPKTCVHCPPLMDCRHTVWCYRAKNAITIISRKFAVRKIIRFKWTFFLLTGVIKLFGDLQYKTLNVAHTLRLKIYSQLGHDALQPPCISCILSSYAILQCQSNKLIHKKNQFTVFPNILDDYLWNQLFNVLQ